MSRSLEKPAGHAGSVLPCLFALLLILVGLALALPGAYLASLGGSLYYLIGGAAVVVSGVLLLQKRRAGAWLYALFFIGTLLWSLSEAGFDFWALIPRLGVFVVLGLWFLTPWFRRSVA